MRRKRRSVSITRLAALGCGLALAAALPRALWHARPPQPISLLVLDKTVPDEERSEHRGIFWVLRNERYEIGGRLPDARRDYIGFHPESGRADSLTADLLRAARVVYLADAYGVYDYPRGHQRYEKDIARREADLTLRYGGLRPFEVSALRQRFMRGVEAGGDPGGGAARAAHAGGCLVAEFNVLAYPTFFDSTTWRDLQSLLHVSYTGWFGAYYDDLQGAARGGRKILYERLTGQPWDFRGPGLILVHEADVPGWKRDIVVLTREDLDEEVPRIELSPALAARLGSPREVPWGGTFDLVRPAEGTEVLATLRLGAGTTGAAKLAAAGLPSRFPLIVHWRGAWESYYLAGNFARETAPRWAERSRGYVEYQTLNARSAPGWRRSDGFWLFYAPFLRALFREHRDA